jgi:hypothetical protein
MPLRTPTRFQRVPITVRVDFPWCNAYTRSAQRYLHPTLGVAADSGASKPMALTTFRFQGEPE